MLLALATLGYSGESKQFYDVLAQAAMQGPERLQIGYGLALERELPERNLTHLDGYRGSRPVRIGNAAFTQHQADLYGYVLDAVLAYRELGGSIAPEHRPHFAALVDHVAVIADQPDLGIWEVRAEPQHFVHSKAACWAALDRGIRLFGARAPWLEQRDRVLESLRREGCGPRGYTRAYASADTDAALLLLPALGLPMSRAQLDLTLDRIQHELLSGEYVYRYRAEDGMAGKEGAFLACSFWLVDALLSADRGAQAHALFSRLIARANDVGLYSEEADPASGVMLGNFPQALTHLALVSSATSLALYDEHGVEALAGAYADHARRSVGATIGWRGVMAALFRAGMWPKLFASQHSRLSI